MTPSLTPCSTQSYIGNPLPDLVGWLTAAGFEPIPTCSAFEYARLRDGTGRLVIVYISSLVVVAGQAQASTHQLLAPLIPAPSQVEQRVLPW